MNWIPYEEGKPTALPGQPHDEKWSRWVAVRVLYLDNAFHMLGSWNESRRCWCLRDFPQGYGGPSFTNRGPMPQPRVTHWALLEK